MLFVSVFVYSVQGQAPYVFTTEVATAREQRMVEATLRYKLRKNANMVVRAHARRSRDWVDAVGEFVPLHLDRMIGNPSYSHAIRLEDPSYAKYYSDNLYLENGVVAELSYTLGGWLVPTGGEREAAKFVEEMNANIIPQSDTLEWEAFHDEENQRVLFYPYFPGQVGEQEDGDTFTQYGKWDDVARAFVFSEEDWENVMAFYGYEC